MLINDTGVVSPHIGDMIPGTILNTSVKNIKDVSRVFDEFCVNTHLC